MILSTIPEKAKVVLDVCRELANARLPITSENKENEYLSVLLATSAS